MITHAARIVDCHAHVIDPVRFRFVDGPGYRPRPDETGTREMFRAVREASGVSHALLVQPSGYGFDNRAMLDAMAADPGRYKAIAVVDPEASERTLDALAEAGTVGMRFNLVTYQRDALQGAPGRRLLARLAARGWFAQIFAHDEQWPEIAPVLRQAGVRVLIDHFGVRAIAGGVGQPGFQAVLALGREGNAAVKLSAPFRISRIPETQADLDPFAAALRSAFGPNRCVWGSDWPFLDVARPPIYAAALAALERWVPDARERERVLRDNPARLFGFKG